MRKAVLLAVVFLVGCGPIKVTVYGKSGAPYVAPDLCAALLQCQKAGEVECLYADSLTIDETTHQQVEYRCRALNVAGARRQ